MLTPKAAGVLARKILSAMTLSEATKLARFAARSAHTMDFVAMTLDMRDDNVLVSEMREICAANQKALDGDVVTFVASGRFLTTLQPSTMEFLGAIPHEACRPEEVPRAVVTGGGVLWTTVSCVDVRWVGKA